MRVRTKIKFTVSVEEDFFYRPKVRLSHACMDIGARNDAQLSLSDYIVYFEWQMKLL